MSTNEMHAILETFGKSILEILREGQKTARDTTSLERRKISAPALNNIKPFGGRHTENLLSWSFQVSDVFEAYDTCLEDRLRLVSGLLTDAALQWYLNTRQGINKGNEETFIS